MQRAKGKAGGGKGSDPFSQRTTRNERFAQMSRQEQLIEQKKKELLAKAQSATSAAAKPATAATSASASGSLSKPLVRPTGILGKRPNWWKNKGSASAAAAAPDAPAQADEPVSIKIEPHHQKFPKMMEVVPIKREFKTEPMHHGDFKTESMHHGEFKTEPMHHGDFKMEPMHLEAKYSPSSSYSYDRGNDVRPASPYSPSRLSPEPGSPIAAPPVYSAPPPSMLVPPFPPPALTSAPPPPLMMTFAAPPPQSAPPQPPPMVLMSVPPPNLSAPPPQMQFLQQPPPPQQQAFVMETQQEVAKVSPAGLEASNAACRQLADMVAEGGDEIEEMARERNRDDPAMWFLYQTESDAYRQYRELVSNLRMLKNASKESAAAAKNAERMRKRKSRWAPEGEKVPIPPSGLPMPIIPKGGPPPMLSAVRRTDNKLLAYARSAYGTVDLSEEDWVKCEDHYKVHLLYNEMMRKKEQLARLEAAGKHKYDYDSDEDVDGGTWEHKVRSQEMEATNKWAAELTKQAEGKHHIGDFLPPAELERFMEQYSAAKEGKPLDVSDYKEFKLKEDNIGFKMLQKLGWSEGQGLGSEGQGIVDPVSKGNSRSENHGLGVKRPDNFNSEDDEYDAYRKRMMLAYRFRPNPLNNPRRNYY